MFLLASVSHPVSVTLRQGSDLGRLWVMPLSPQDALWHSKGPGGHVAKGAISSRFLIPDASCTLVPTFPPGFPATPTPFAVGRSSPALRFLSMAVSHHTTVELNPEGWGGCPFKDSSIVVNATCSSPCSSHPRGVWWGQVSGGSETPGSCFQGELVCLKGNPRVSKRVWPMPGPGSGNDATAPPWLHLLPPRWV